jgi:hypothetical protein
MEKLVRRFLNESISRREFVRGLTALGVSTIAARSLLAQVETNAPLGQGKGIFPGRVVWVRDPAATTWDGTTGFWWEDTNSHQAVIDRMVSRSLQALTGKKSDKQAWDDLFTHFNQTHGFGTVGYKPGETVAIKLNCNQDRTTDWGGARVAPQMPGMGGGLGRGREGAPGAPGGPGMPPGGMPFQGGAPGGGPPREGAPGAGMPQGMPDRPGGQPGSGGGMGRGGPQNGVPSPHLVLALVDQLIRAGVRGEDITFWECAMGRTIGEPIATKIRANSAAGYQAVRFLVNNTYDHPGRILPTPDMANPIRFANSGLPNCYVPQQVTAAKYVINMPLLRAHGIAGFTLSAKNHFGSTYFPDNGGWTPAPIHNFVSSRSAMGTYNAFVDLSGYRHLGGKTLLFIFDGLYTAASNEGSVIRWSTFGDRWGSSILMSQDQIAIDSVGLDILKSEPNFNVQGNADNYLHEAALADKPPSGSVYDPNGTGKPLASLGVHEHWNNAKEKKYSRNLGKKEGIELIAELG